MSLTVKQSRETIALDFDGVLHNYAEWEGVTVIGEPVPGAKHFVEWLVARGYHLYILSTRAHHEGGKEAIEEWLAEWGFPALKVTDRKIGGCLLIDDRGWRFEGNFGPLYELLTETPEPGRWGLKENK